MRAVDALNNIRPLALDSEILVEAARQFVSAELASAMGNGGARDERSWIELVNTVAEFNEFINPNSKEENMREKAKQVTIINVISKTSTQFRTLDWRFDRTDHTLRCLK